MNAGAFSRQEGGNHYKDMAIQPVEFILKNGLGFCEGNVVKYVSRWRAKGGVEDLRKARHYLDLLIEDEEQPRAALGERKFCTPWNTTMAMGKVDLDDGQSSESLHDIYMRGHAT
jgi:hypothetical protein